MTARLRELPAVHRLTTDPAVSAYEALLGRSTIRSCVQSILDDARTSMQAGTPHFDFDELRSRVLERLAGAQTAGLVNVINGTGILLHTNFGRAPLAAAALANAQRLGAGYTNLEYDLPSGKRGSRYERVALQLCELCDAQAALVVNNCAAAVLLVLDTFARNREVVVSRGQLIEIGGGFRLPDVLQKSSAKLVEVGTTNKTYPLDYRNAWTQETALFMRTHPSNYRIEGFVAEVDAKTLAGLARELGVISFEDLGSGALVDLERFGLPHEPTVAEEISAGIDLVAFSGDKLLGGPQCGILCGKADLLDVAKRNPLLRALRVDKLTLAALGATLSLYLEDKLGEIPLFAMLSTTPEALRARAAAVCDALRKRQSTVQAQSRDTQSATGGGTLPQARIPSAGIALAGGGLSAEGIAIGLRKQQPPIVGRIESDEFVIDLRTVAAHEDAMLISSVAQL